MLGFADLLTKFPFKTEQDAFHFHFTCFNETDGQIFASFMDNGHIMDIYQGHLNVP
jgi:hypothetical protein